MREVSVIAAELVNALGGPELIERGAMDLIEEFCRIPTSQPSQSTRSGILIRQDLFDLLSLLDKLTQQIEELINELTDATTQPNP